MTDPLVKVSPAELPDVWPKVRDRIEEIRSRFNEQWLPEHIFYEILQGGTHLWTTPDLRGFVVLQVLVSPYARDLHVWLAWNDTEARVADYFEQLKALAEENGCQNVTGESDRMGWLRAIPGIRVRQRYMVPVGE